MNQESASDPIRFLRSLTTQGVEAQVHPARLPNVKGEFTFDPAFAVSKMVVSSMRVGRLQPWPSEAQYARALCQSVVAPLVVFCQTSPVTSSVTVSPLSV